MKKAKILFSIITLMLMISFSFANVYAEENEDIDTKKIEEETQKDIVLELIKKCLNEIDNTLNELDSKIAKVKEQKEFEYYPAIRLNIDTPMFGMSSLVENKLRIKKDISTSDVASRYSIRDVVKNKSIKLPDNMLGSIIVSTRDIKIDKKMTLTEANVTLLKCIQYLSQANSTNDFLDTQVNKIFKGYIAEEKNSRINEIKNKTSNIEKTLLQVSEQLTRIRILGEPNEEYTEKYISIADGVYAINLSIRNSLILDEDLTNLAKLTITYESEVLDLSQKVNKLYQDKIKDIDDKKLVETVYNGVKARTEKVEAYIKGSTTEEKRIVDGKEEIKTIINYNVTSKATLEYMNLILKEIEVLRKEMNVETKTLEEELTDEQIKERKEQKIQDSQKLLDTLYGTYCDFLSRENKFYLNNINMLIKDSSDKIASIVEESETGVTIDTSIFSYMTYVYIDLPNDLTASIEENSFSSMIELNRLINKLKNVIEELSKTDANITKQYQKMIEEILKS